MRFQAPRGTEDVTPEQAPAWQFVEKTFVELAGRYGYREIRTPTFEDIELFTRTSGETSEAVSKQMYDFVDKGGRHIALKPEGTAPAMRALLEHNLCPPGTVERLFYITPVFRYERPQAGRLREHHQVGLELAGSPSPAADAEIIEVTVRFFEALGLKGVRASLNSLGRTECRRAYREALLKYAEPFLLNQPEEFQDKARKNPLRMLDTKDPVLLEAMQAAPRITSYLEPESVARRDEVQRLLAEAEIGFDYNDGIVRGLDYYTETVFEIHAEGIGAQSALCGGGRYDDLISDIGGPSTPSVGVGIGIERALLALKMMSVPIPSPRPDVFVICSVETAEMARRRTRELRARGLTVLGDIDLKSWKSQLRQADKTGARFALILGEDEMASGRETLKDLGTGEQTNLSPEEVSQKLGKAKAAP